jgi:hypothetical protein
MTEPSRLKTSRDNPAALSHRGSRVGPEDLRVAWSAGVIPDKESCSQQKH